MFRYHTPDNREERAYLIAKTIEGFSTLQLYGVIFNEPTDQL
jgi:hypothetical protein